MALSPADPTAAIIFLELSVKVIAPFIAFLILLSGLLSSVMQLKKQADAHGAKMGESIGQTSNSSPVDRTSSKLPPRRKFRFRR